MQLNIILGNTIDSLTLVRKLKAEGERSIVILDYDLLIDYQLEQDITYISPKSANRFIEKAKSVRFHKSMYIYPGMYRKNIE